MKRRKGRLGTVGPLIVLLLGLVVILAACEDPLGAEEDNGNDNGNGITDPIDDDDANGDDNGVVVERSLPLSGTIAGSVPYNEAGSTFADLDTSFVADDMEIEVYQVPDDQVPFGDAIILESNEFDLTITVPEDWSQTFEEFLEAQELDLDDTELDFNGADLSSILVMQVVLDLVSDESEWALVDGKTVTGGSTVEFYDYWWVDQEITIDGEHGPYTFDNVTLSPGWNHVPTVWDAADDSYSRSATENTIAEAQWIAVDEDDDNDA